MTDTVNVPREPTREMWAAGGNAACRTQHQHHDAIVEAVWGDMLAAAPKAKPVDAELFLQEAISASPQPLRDLGEFLSSVLDEDHWKTADRLLLAIAAGRKGGAAGKGTPKSKGVQL